MKTAVACATLVAAAFADEQAADAAAPVAAAPLAAASRFLGNPYGARVVAPYWQTGARVAAPVAVAAPYVNQQANLQQVQAGVTGVYDAVSKAKKAQLQEEAERYRYLAARGAAWNDAADNDDGRYMQYHNLFEFQVTDTDAQKAHEAFVKNPNRQTSIKADYTDNFAKSDQYKLLFPGASHNRWGPAGRYENMGYTGKLEAAEDGLKRAERNMAFNDDASAYYKALDAYNDAESKAWEHTFRLSGDNFAANQIEAARKINSYLNQYDTYAASPDQRNTEDLHIAELKLASWWMDDVRDNDRLHHYLDWQAARANSKAQAARAQAAGADFTVNYGQYFG